MSQEHAEEHARVAPAALGDLARQRLSRGGPFRFYARGLSMRPSIPDGARVTVAPVGSRSVRPGDVVLLLVGERASVHRVVARWAGLVWTKGDLNPWTDPPVSTASVLGRVVAVEHGGSHRRLDHTADGLCGVGWAALALLAGLRGSRWPGFV